MKALKRSASLILSCLLCVILCACGQEIDAQAPEGMKKVDAPSSNYTLYVPQAWTVDMSTGVISAYASLTDRANISLTVFALEDRNATLDSFWADYAEEFASTFGDSMYYYDEKGAETRETVSQKTTLGGIEANKYVYRAKVTGEVYKFMQVVCIVAGNVYIITYTAIDGNYDSHVSEVNDVLNNFKFN